ncbi:MAG: hypothetical protein WAT71_13780 [Ignavibacteria bacterium]
MDNKKFKLTSNEKSANGPLTGDISLYQKELHGCESLPTPGYYPALNSAEIADSERSGLYPFATFLGSFEGPNKVYAWRSEDIYETASFINNRKPGELFITGGVIPDLKGPIAPGPFIAKADATTGKQIWKTYLWNANLSDKWLATTNLNLLSNGLIVTSWSNQIALLDPDTGLILKTNTLPVGTTPEADVSFKHLTVAPDGTLILKNQSRPTGSKDQSSKAIFTGIKKGLKQGNSIIVAVNPDSLEVIDQIQMSEPATTPHVITMYEDKIAIYISADKNAYRYFWNPNSKKLSQDISWKVSYLSEGQTTGDAPGVMGDYIVIQTNGIGGKVASSIVAISQKDQKKMTTIFPFGKLKKLQMSLAPPKSGTDIENNMVYSADAGVGKVAGIKLDQDTGKLEAAFVIDCCTLAFQPLIGPKDKRVLILSNMKTNIPIEPTLLGLKFGNYKEQVTWRDALTGRLLAESDFFEPLTIGSLMTPGYGGRIYFPTENGFITFQVMPE